MNLRPGGSPVMIALSGSFTTKGYIEAASDDDVRYATAFRAITSVISTGRRPTTRGNVSLFLAGLSGLHLQIFTFT